MTDRSCATLDIGKSNTRPGLFRGGDRRMIPSPIIDNFERALHFARPTRRSSGSTSSMHLLSADNGTPREDLRFAAAMLLIPCGERHGATAVTPQKFKDETLRTLVDTTEAIATRRRALLTLPSTTDTLSHDRDGN